MTGFLWSPPHQEAITKFAEWHDVGACFIEWESTDSTIDWRTASNG